MSVEQVASNLDGLRWFKSSHSGSDGGNCVEVAADLDAVYVRDSKTAGNEPTLRVAKANWASFVFATANADQEM